MKKALLILFSPRLSILNICRLKGIIIFAEIEVLIKMRLSHERINNQHVWRKHGNGITVMFMSKTKVQTQYHKL